MKNNLKEIRTNAGLTQEQLAEALGTSKTYISQLETGARNIDTIRQSTMEKLCAALGCKESDLIIPIDFQFNDEGKLIVDSIWHDPRFQSGYILLIGGNAFFVPMGRYYENGEAVVKALRPLKFYTKGGKRTCKIAEYEYAFLPCDPKDGINVKLGRPITDDELAHIRKEYNITDDDISDRFIDTKGSIYGKKYMKTYACVQVRVPSSKAIDLERVLMEKGIEALNIDIGRVNIRVE